MYTEWNIGERRLAVELICCPHCGSVDVYRRGSKDATGHWRCRHCSQHWTEDIGIGRGKECNAKLEAPIEIGIWETGSKRVEAEVVCCPSCGCTKVRCSSARSLIGYWYCSQCGQGWNEAGHVARDKACRVKLSAAFGGHISADTGIEIPLVEAGASAELRLSAHPVAHDNRLTEDLRSGAA